MTGFGVLFRKELAEAWRTRRLLVVAVLFLVRGMISPLTARYLPEILGIALADELTVPLPPATVAMAVDQLQQNLGQLGTLAAIALAMGAVAGEIDRGTAAFVLAQPATRGAFLGAKLVSLAVVLAIATTLAVVIAWSYTAVLFEPLPVTGWIVFGVLAWLALVAWASLTFLASAVTGSAAAAAGIGFVALIALSLIAIIPQVDQVLPTGLGRPAFLFALGQSGDVEWSRFATALMGTAGVIGFSALGALASFRRREL
jgi:ABC-2 type transport system permease protein